jgi:protein gp37
MSKIEWTDITWNPVTGCSWVSPGCDNCYAKTMANRLHSNPKMDDKYRNNFKVTCHPEELKRDFGKKSKKVFVCSMGDLFHKDVPGPFQDDIFGKIEYHPGHIFQILTKRPEMALEYQDFHCMPYPDNVWFGVTAENQEQYDKRRDGLFGIEAQVKFISIEPMLSEIVLRGDCWELDVDWVIVGGETGPGAREMNPNWARSIRDQCKKAEVPFFFKQMSRKQPTPDDLNIKEFPV